MRTGRAEVSVMVDTRATDVRDLEDLCYAAAQVQKGSMHKTRARDGLGISRLNTASASAWTSHAAALPTLPPASASASTPIPAYDARTNRWVAHGWPVVGSYTHNAHAYAQPHTH